MEQPIPPTPEKMSSKIYIIIFFFVLLVLFYLIRFGGGFMKIFSEYIDIVNYNEQGIVAMNEQRYDEAEEFLIKAVEKTGKDDREELVTIYNNLGILYDNQGKTEEAITAFQKSLTNDSPETSQYHSTMGNINILKGNLDIAIKNFEKALELNPEDFDAHNNLGLIYMGEIDESIEDYEKAVVHNKKAYEDSKDLATQQNLAVNYYFLADYEEALPLFQEVDKQLPNQGFAKYFIGLIHYINQDYEKAKIYLEKAIEIDPSYNSEDTQEILEDIRGQLES